jgi:hypothetical protein
MISAIVTKTPTALRIMTSPRCCSHPVGRGFINPPSPTAVTRVTRAAKLASRLRDTTAHSPNGDLAFSIEYTGARDRSRERQTRLVFYASPVWPSWRYAQDEFADYAHDVRNGSPVVVVVPVASTSERDFAMLEG